MFKSIQTRTMYYLVVLSVGLLVTIGFIMSTFVENVSHEQKEDALKERALLLSALLESDEREGFTPNDYYTLLKESSDLPSDTV